jgi:CP family cyanate transporter-like MFS transporter
VALIGLGPLLFPVVLTLINLRTRSHQVSASLSGFSQGVGYGFGALGPLLIGVIHDLSGGWTVPLLVMFAVSLVGVATGLALQHPRFVEDDLARHQG